MEVRGNLLPDAVIERVGMTDTNRPPQNPQSPAEDRPAAESDASGSGSRKKQISAEAIATGESVPDKSRQERLRRIRQDVDAGQYDSDDLLEQALRTMLKRVCGDAESQESVAD